MITTDWLVVSPAYGRDYKSAKDAKAAFLGGYDFVMESPGVSGTYCTVRDFAPGVTVEVRYKQKSSFVHVRVPAHETLVDRAKQAAHSAKILQQQVDGV